LLKAYGVQREIRIDKIMKWKNCHQKRKYDKSKC